jgi:hypothetical protein
MRTSSAKSKGRRACADVKELLHQFAPNLEPDDIIVTPSGVTGEDIRLSPEARRIYPFAIECKNQESLNIWSAYEQAIEHSKDTKYTPILFYKRNRSDLMVSLTAEDFMILITSARILKKMEEK